MEFLYAHRRIALIGGAIAILLGTSAYIIHRSNESAPISFPGETESLLPENITASPSGTAENDPSAVSPSNEHLIKRAFSGNATTSCKLTTADGTAQFFIKKEMFRITEITPKGAPEPLKDEILTLNATVWIWNSVNKTGYMMSDLTGIYSSSTVLKKLYEASDEELKEGFTSAGLTLTDCLSQKVDESLFTLPTDVEFKTITETIRDTLLSR